MLVKKQLEFNHYWGLHEVRWKTSCFLWFQLLYFPRLSYTLIFSAIFDSFGIYLNDNLAEVRLGKWTPWFVKPKIQ